MEPRAPHSAQLPPSAAPSSRCFFLSLRPPSPPPPRACVCSAQARGPREQSRLGARRSCGCSCCRGKRRGGRLAPPRTCHVGAEQPLAKPLVGRRWERGTCKLLLGVFSPPSFGPCPRRKWSVELGDHYFFRQLRGAPTRRSPVGLSAVGAPLCVWFPPAHLGRR